MYDRGMNHHVVVDEFRRTRRIGENAAHGTRDEKNELGPVGAKPIIHRGLIAQIHLIARRGQHVGVPELL